MAAYQGSPESVTWVGLGPDTKIKFLRSVLLPKKQLQSSEPIAANVPMEMSESSLPIAQQQKPDCSALIQQNATFKQRFIELFAKPVQWTNLSTFQSILSLSITPFTLTHQPG